MIKNDLSGKTFGLLKVESFSDEQKKWRCVCIYCGTVSFVSASNFKLMKLGCKPCAYKQNGINQTKDLSNKRFGNLIAVRLHKRLTWLCKCDCGNEVIKRTASLLYENTTSCTPCNRRQRGLNAHKNVIGDIPNTFWTVVKKGAEQRNYDFTITPKYAYDLLINQKYKCAVSGVDIGFRVGRYSSGILKHTASLDRIDNSKGYIEGNVEWLHNRVNIMKMTDSKDDFINWCKTIAINNS